MVIDISQELFSCQVFPGDPAPAYQRIRSIPDGDGCNLTTLSLCAHNGTHIDAPFHFFQDGRTVDALEPEIFAGPAYVATYEGAVTAEAAQRICAKARACGADARILLRGHTVVTAASARVFAGSGLRLIGNESQTFGPENSPAEVHHILLGAGIVLLEGIRLGAVADGRYLLCALPLKLAGCDGAPCRAVLMTE